MHNLLSFFVSKAHATIDAALCPNFYDALGNKLAEQSTSSPWANCVSTTTSIADEVASTLFNAVLNLISIIIPYAIGVLVFYIGYRLARRAMGGS